jgi:cytochrome c oxidase subunit 2
LLLLLAACDADSPSILEPRGPAASRIESLWWLILWIATAVFLVVVGFLVVAVLRSRRRVTIEKDVSWGDRFIIFAGVVLPALILVGVFILSLRDMSELSDRGRTAEITLEIVSHDWWWEVRYPNGATSANEIHIPTGEPVRMKLLSADVIHSFWVPQLQGKIDHVTGRENYLWLEADEPGRYRGQCAEFCGLQHAKMAFYVVAEEPESFERWMEGEEEDAADADGSDVFLTSTCAGCHAVRGTEATSTVGPDLTHLADRETLFAGTLPNDRESLERVITDPQSVKPGVAMPPTDLSDTELESLLDYLEGLD